MCLIKPYRNPMFFITEFLKFYFRLNSKETRIVYIFIMVFSKASKFLLKKFSFCKLSFYEMNIFI